jgi:predicted anti-sigma-YlaC factor YlaD
MSAPLPPMRRHRARCRETRAGLSDYLDGELEEPHGTERHLRWCPSCRRMAVNLARTVAGLRRLPATRRP